MNIEKSEKSNTILAITPIHRASCISPLSEALVEMLPLSLEIVATDESLDDNGGAMRELGVVGGVARNGSCSELRGL